MPRRWDRGPPRTGADDETRSRILRGLRGAGLRELHAGPRFRRGIRRGLPGSAAAAPDVAAAAAGGTSSTPPGCRAGCALRGFQRPVPGTPDADSEKQALRQQADALQAELEAIRKRLDEIEKAAPAE